MTRFGAQRIVLRSRKPCSQARQDVVGNAERGAPPLEPPAGNGGERAVVQQFDIVGDLRRIEIAHQVQRLQDFLGAAGEFRPVQDVDDRAFDRGHTDRHPLPIHGHGQVVGLPAATNAFGGVTKRQAPNGRSTRSVRPALMS